ncbi:MAG: gephyrin-like molybdotransferase Glp [Actinomycetota bacterium]
MFSAAAQQVRRTGNWLIQPQALRQLILGEIDCLTPRRLALTEVIGLVLAAPIVAGSNLPRFPNSAMDGFALLASDTAEPPAVLRIVGSSLPGAPCDLPVAAGEAVAIATGAMLPGGSDAVVPIELVDVTGLQLTMAFKAAPGMHVRLEGEDVTEDQVVIECGTEIGPGQLVAAAALGIDEVVVHPRPRVAILPTGDEVRTAGSRLGPGEIYDAVSVALGALVAEVGGKATMLPAAPDDSATLIRMLHEATLGADAIITVGGVSAGERDFIRGPEAPVRVWPYEVALRPARPFGFGTAFDKPLFALPGNPASALAAFEEFVRPALRCMMDKSPAPWPMLTAVLTEPLEHESGFTHLVRVQVWREGARLFARSSGRQGAGMVHSLAKANAWAVIPADVSELAAGSEVCVRMLGEPWMVAPPNP